MDKATWNRWTGGHTPLGVSTPRPCHPVTTMSTTYIDLTRLAQKKKRDRSNPNKSQSKRRKAWWREKRRKDRRSFDWESGVKGKDRGVNQYARMRYPLAGWKMMACGMSPGRAYTRSEVYGVLPDAPINSVSPWLSQWLVSGGYVARLPNPDYQGGKPGSYWSNTEKNNPQWLYRLTAGGCVAREEWLAALDRS